MSSLDISPLAKAISRLSDGLEEYSAHPAMTIVRDGVIQRFEFTYELSHKMLKRFLETYTGVPGQYDQINFQELIRIGNEEGLLRSNWQRWREYRDARSITSHTYDEAKAKQVLQVIPDFLAEAEYLFERLEKRNG